MKLIFIRHFPTAGNLLKQYIGCRTDEPIDQAVTSRLLEELGDYRAFYPEADSVVISPMLRCRQTADFLYPGIPVFSFEHLRECDFGDFEGKTYDQLKSVEDYQQWLMSGAGGEIPNGESRYAFQKRCLIGFGKAIEQLLEKECETAAFVVHGGTIMALMSCLAEKKLSFYDWRVKPGDGYTMNINIASLKKGKKCLFNIRKL